MTMEQTQAVAKAVHEGLRRNGTVVLYSAAFERIVGDAIRTHLLSQDAEIDYLRTSENLSTLQYNRMLAKYEKAESRLAAADALLRELGEEMDRAMIFPVCKNHTAEQLAGLRAWHAEIDAHLQGAGDEA